MSLGTIDSVSDATRTLTLFDRGKTPVDYTVQTSAPWIVASESAGTVGAAEQKVVLHVDWRKVPADGDSVEGTVTVSSGDALPMTYTLRALRLPITRAEAQGFVESDGYVAMEAADTWRRTADGETRWEELPGYGETRSAMTVFPVTAESNTDSKAALEYKMYLYDAGDFQLQATLAPTLNFVPGRGLRFAVSVDGGPRTVVDVLEHNSQQDWEKAVSDGARRVTLPLTIAKPGYHTLEIWAVDPGVVLERIVVSHGPLQAELSGTAGEPSLSRLRSRQPAFEWAGSQFRLMHAGGQNHRSGHTAMRRLLRSKCPGRAPAERRRGGLPIRQVETVTSDVSSAAAERREALGSLLTYRPRVLTE